MTNSRVALALLLAAGTAAAGCKLPEKVLSLVARPTPTPMPTPTPVPVPPLKMEFVKIREERARGTEGKPACAIDIQLEGTKRSEVEAARVLVRNAVDDLGTSLVLDNAAAAALEPLGKDDPDAPLVLSIPLKVASRKATSIRDVSGEIELSVRAADAAPPAGAPKPLRRYRFGLKDVPLP